MLNASTMDLYRPINTDNQRSEIFLIEFEDVIKSTEEAVLITMLEEYQDWTECYPEITTLKAFLDEIEKNEYDNIINNLGTGVEVVTEVEEYREEAKKKKYRAILQFLDTAPLYIFLKHLNSPLTFEEIQKDIESVKEYATYKYNSTLIFEDAIKHLKSGGIIEKIIFFNNPFRDSMVEYLQQNFMLEELDSVVLGDDGNLLEAFNNNPEATTVCCKNVDELYELIIGLKDKEILRNKQFMISCMGFNFDENREIKHFKFFKSLYENYGARLEIIQPKISDGPSWDSILIKSDEKI